MSNHAALSIYPPYPYAPLRQAQRNPQLWGHMFESAIGAHLIHQAFIHRFQLYYWRQDNLEVDFILKARDRLIAIEVKSNDEGYTKGLSHFASRFQPHIACIVGRDGIDPETFLRMDLSEL